MSHFFGPIRQMGYVVRDIDAAMKYWTETLRIGPFFYFEKAPVFDFTVNGEPSDAVTSVALSQSGPMQVELIMPRDDRPSPYNDFLNEGHEGLQHVAFWTPNFDADLKRATDAGFEVILSGYTVDPSGKFVYFSAHDHPGTMVELSALSPSKKKVFDMVEAEAAKWDGKNPIRRLDT